MHINMECSANKIDLKDPGLFFNFNIFFQLAFYSIILNNFFEPPGYEGFLNINE